MKTIKSYCLGSTAPALEDLRTMVSTLFGSGKVYDEWRDTFTKAWEMASVEKALVDRRRVPDIRSPLELARLKEIAKWYPVTGDSTAQRLERNIAAIMVHTFSERFPPTRPPTPEHLDLARLLFRQVFEDFRRSVLTDTIALAKASEQSARHAEIIRHNVKSTTINLVNWSLLSDFNSRSEPDPGKMQVLRDSLEKIGRKVYVSVGSCDAGACAVLWWMQMDGLPIEIISSDASGLLQARRWNDEDERCFDFLIMADAPAFYIANRSAKSLTKRLDIHTELQAGLRKRGDAKGRKPVLWIYPNSSVRLQLEVDYPNLSQSLGIDKDTVEIEIELVDYKNVSASMAPGDIVFAWMPLLETLREDPLLELLDHTEFELMISLFQNYDWLADERFRPIGLAFIDCFVSYWNRARRNLVLTWLISLTNSKLLADFARSMSSTFDP